VRIQTAEVNATKRLLRGAGWLVGTRASLRSAGSWDRLLDALAVVPELQAHIRFHRAVWQQTGEQVRAVDHLLGELARSWRDDVRRLARTIRECTRRSAGRLQGCWVETSEGRTAEQRAGMTIAMLGGRRR
jgi:hypothetical protein